MVLTEAPITAFFNFLFFAKALAAMAVIWKDCPLMVTVFPMVMLFLFLDVGFTRVTVLFVPLAVTLYLTPFTVYVFHFTARSFFTVLLLLVLFSTLDVVASTRVPSSETSP